MNHIKLITLLLITAFICSCEPSMKKEVKKKLEEKYGEEFKVYHDAYNYILYEYHFQASPKNNKKLVFGGEHNKNMTHFKDGYIPRVLSEKITTIVKDKIEGYTTPAYVYCYMGYQGIGISETINVDTLNVNRILYSHKSIYFNIYCYLFQELTERNKKALLTGIYKVIEPYKQHPDASIALYLTFFKSEFLKGHSARFFEFNPRKNSTPDIRGDARNYVTQRLNLFLDTDQPFIDFNVDTLYKYTQRVTPENFGVPPTNLNELAEKQNVIHAK